MQSLKSLCARALIFSLFLNSFSICEMFRFGPNSPKLFSDWDEPFYFQFARQIGATPLTEILSKLPALPESVSYRNVFFPHSLVDVAVGKFLANSSIPPTLVGLGFDLFFPVISYIIFSALFRTLGCRKWAAECASVVVHAFPGIAAFSQYAHIPLHLGFIESSALNRYPCVPILRGIYTQVSFPVYGLALLLTAKAFQSNQNTQTKYFIYAGICSGLSIYTYFYCWAALSALIVFWLFTKIITEAQSRRCFVKNLLLFILGNGIFALPGISLLAKVGNSNATVLPPNAFDFLYLPLEVCIPLLVCTFLHFLWKKDQLLNQIVPVLLACWSATIVLPNSQFFLRAPLLGYHFPVFFFDPLASGLLCAVIVGRSFSENLLKLSYTLLLICSIFSAQGGWKEKDAAKEDFAKFADYAAVNTAVNSVIVSQALYSPLAHSSVPQFSLEGRQTPLWIEAMLDRRSFLNVPKDGVTDDAVKAEFATGFYVNGEAKLTADCIKSSDVTLPWDLDLHFVAEHLLYRAKACERAAHLKPDMCELIRQFPVDYILWEHAVNPLKPEWYDWGSDLVWKGANGELALFKVKQEILLQHFCDNKKLSDSGGGADEAKTSIENSDHSDRSE